MLGLTKMSLVNSAAVVRSTVISWNMFLKHVSEN
jgi:hypothetical protein